ncbi:hypothetical protein IAI10_13260 [Clostridium sp. 19966]|uniref:hypothetical protein n=1 Tax=Clostridium sp. 19966 TaxID=2768166 RepID=UPI0028DF77D6|nr:hypothetical protein [Clostridium sp. 19966]MDT8717635.1 hypothetical protein [Clostridium sp. 19966]
MGFLAIRKVMYIGEKYTYESPWLNNGLNIINGGNGTGKTTLMNLIYFALGGSVGAFDKSSKKSKHTQICSDKNNYVKLFVEIDNKGYCLTRFIYENDITVLASGEAIGVFPVNRYNDSFTFSDWLLDQLHIEVLEIFQGNINWKLNFYDLMRLIYHDQQADPSPIYKTLDNNFYLADSEMYRKAIFEVLMGKSYGEYYKKVSELKRKEKQKELKSEVLSSYKVVRKELLDDEDEVNSIFLTEKNNELKIQLNMLYNYRNSMRLVPNTTKSTLSQFENLNKELLIYQEELNEMIYEYDRIIREKDSIVVLKNDAFIELQQIKKIIFTQEKIDVFNPDVCPYCLSKVERKENHCICGNEIKEDDYQKFFYSSNEYKEILKSKQKSIVTMDIAIEDCDIEADEIYKKIEEKKEKISNLKAKIIDKSKDINESYSFSSISEIDDKILEIKEKIQKIDQSIILENKRESLEKELKKVLSELDKLKIDVNILESIAQKEMIDIKENFGKVYEKYLREADKGCRVAAIKDNYMPSINNNEYREKSSLVPMRLMYFLTLLKLSTQLQTNYPRLLLIDTPETAGIDAENLIGCIAKIDELLLSEKDTNFQIILTTAENKYPKHFKKYVMENLTAENKLLKFNN